ncbi:MAG TPA: PEP-CTERM sorting domain-containing protein, partial [Verrucomicrobiae bacterium]|nr:PEP-CTERM sorting domain-containing protein [Verrucomicrobiae bacterium]
MAAGSLGVSVCHAGITGIEYEIPSTNLGGAPTLSYNQDHTAATMNFDVNQSGAGLVNGTIHADSESDPSLLIGGAVNNDTATAWTGYSILIYMDRPFTLSNVGVGPIPADWNYATVDPALNPTPVYYGAGEYVAEIDYAAGTPIAPEGEFDFQYRLTFEGSTQYSFSAQMNPVPEPGSLALGALGILGLLGVSRHRRK